MARSRSDEVRSLAALCARKCRLTAMASENHAIWSVYDTLRTVRLNWKYYCCLLARAQRLNFGMDVVLAITTPTSTVARLVFFKTGVGAIVWGYILAGAAVVAAVKPTLSLTRKIKELEGAAVGYRGLDFELLEIKQSVEHKRCYDKSLEREFEKATERLRHLIARTPIDKPKVRLLARCQAEVDHELPVESFFVPSE